MAKEIKKGSTLYWKDHEGALVPKRFIPVDVLKSDTIVERMIKRVEKENVKMLKFKQRIENDLKEYLEKLAEKHGEEWEGNATIYNFDKTMAVEVNVAKSISFNEKLSIAKTKIDKLIMKWGEGSNKKLVAIINKSFKVDKKGSFDSKRILELRTLDINDPEWKAAMELISDAIVITGSKVYYNFKRKDDDGKWINITLNFSAI
ncbi:MAG: sulfate transporter [Bacteroidetes bacterium 4572_77]|nr:MAG: sulfate transporter [Bacteroidetes bacterium 4572_77]